MPREDIQRYVRALARKFAPRRVILFGSYATGNPTADSDVDLLVVKEWVEKADGDYATAMREYRARRNPNYDSARFHAQQCIEKMLKSLLDAQDMSIVHTHDLCVLARASVARYPLVALMRRSGAVLATPIIFHA